MGISKSGRGLGKVGVAYEKYLVKSGRGLRKSGWGLRKSGRGLGKVGVAYAKKYSEAQELGR